jgi:hypothetical protein
MMHHRGTEGAEHTEETGSGLTGVAGTLVVEEGG